MSFTTLVPVYHDIGRLHASISSINHARYILRLISVCTSVTSGVTKGWSQSGKLTSKGPLADSQKNTWEIIMKSNVDVYILNL